MKKINEKLSINIKTYIVWFSISFLFVLLDVLKNDYAEVVDISVDIVTKIVEIMSAGMLPAVLLTMLMDYANTKRQKDRYSKHINYNKCVLKSLCEDLPSELLSSLNINEAYEDGEERTFCEWCECIYDEEGLKFFLSDINTIKAEAQSMFDKVNVYNDLPTDSTNRDTAENYKKLVECCNNIHFDCLYKTQKSFYLKHVDELKNAILILFPDLYYYDNPYKSESFCDDCNI